MIQLSIGKLRSFYLVVYSDLLHTATSVTLKLASFLKTNSMKARCTLATPKAHSTSNYLTVIPTHTVSGLFIPLEEIQNIAWVANKLKWSHKRRDCILLRPVGTSVPGQGNVPCCTCAGKCRDNQIEAIDWLQ